MRAMERLSKGERLRLLRAFDELVPRIPARGAAAVERELKAIRQARRAGSRRTSRSPSQRSALRAPWRTASDSWLPR
jgi:hypothetical protein